MKATNASNRSGKCHQTQWRSTKINGKLHAVQEFAPSRANCEEGQSSHPLWSSVGMEFCGQLWHCVASFGAHRPVWQATQPRPLWASNWPAGHRLTNAVGLRIIPTSWSRFEISQEIRVWLKALAPINIFDISVTPEVFQDPMGWLNAHAWSNMFCIWVTRDVFHDPMGWLKAFALWNMYDISVTLEVSHDAMGWLKTLASVNIRDISVTPEVFQDPMGWLKAHAWSNMCFIPVTCEVFHDPMGWLKAFAL